MGEQETFSPYDGWVDFCLIADATCSYVLNGYRRSHGLSCFDVIAIDRDLARMWNLPIKSLETPRELKHPFEETHPFWVDDLNFVHILPDDLVTVKRTKEIEWNCGTTIDLRDPEQLTIRLILVEQLGDILKLRPNIRVLVLDQYDLFLDPNVSNKYQLEFAFTSAPPFGWFDVEREQKFYEKLRNISLSRGIETRETSRDNSLEYKKDRHAYIMWRAYIPNYEPFSKEEDVRWSDIHLLDSNDSLFWRDLISTLLENEYQRKKANANPDENNLCLVIRMRLSSLSKDSTDGTQSGFEKRLGLLRRVKRFGAFFSRVYEIIERNDLKYAPRIFWTCPTSEREYVYSAYADILREYIIGLREGVRPFDRFLHVENIRNSIGSNCAITPEPFAHDANILGVFHETLISIDALFPQTVYALGSSGTYITKSQCGAPIYKLREYEI